MAVVLEMQERKADHVVILDLQGEITIGSTSQLFARKLEELMQRGHANVLLNLAQVTKIDSSGLSVIVRTYVTLYRRQGQVKLLNPRGYVRQVLQITNLLDRIEAYDDEAQALETFR